MNHFDAIVLGAGVGGLTTAALLARAGRAVLLLERGIAPGGVFGTYSPAHAGGYCFDLSAAPLDGLEHGGPLADVAVLLRVRFPVERQQPALHTWLPERVVADPGSGRDALSAHPRNLERFWRHQERVAELTLRSGSRPLLFAHRARTVANELRRCYLDDAALLSYIDAQLVALGLPRATRCPWLLGSAALDMPRRGLFVAPGGAQAVAAVLADAFVRDGGELRYHTTAHQFVVEGGRVCGVLVADDAEYRAPHVVVAAPQPALLTHVLYVALDAETVPVDVGCSHRVALDDAFVSLTLSPAHDIGRAPAGQRTITAVLPDVSRTSSAAAPEAVLAAAVERVLPGALAQATFRHYAEPAAIARLLDAAPALPKPTKLEGLWAASDGGLLNGGSGAAALGGIAAYEGIQRALDWAARRHELGLLRQRRPSRRAAM